MIVGELAQSDPDANLYEKAFYTNMSGLMRRLEDEQIPAELADELKAALIYIKPVTLAGEAA